MESNSIDLAMTEVMDSANEIWVLKNTNLFFVVVVAAVVLIDVVVAADVGVLKTNVGAPGVDVGASYSVRPVLLLIIERRALIIHCRV